MHVTKLAQTMYAASHACNVVSVWDIESYAPNVLKTWLCLRCVPITCTQSFGPKRGQGKLWNQPEILKSRENTQVKIYEVNLEPNNRIGDQTLQ